MPLPGMSEHWCHLELTQLRKDHLSFPQIPLPGMSDHRCHLKLAQLGTDQLSSLKFCKGSCTVGIKNELDDSPFQQLCATNFDTIQFTDHVRETMKPMYSGPVPISSAKYKDLQYLCKTKVIPE